MQDVTDLHFDEYTHTYTYFGQKLTSVTTLISQWFSKFNAPEVAMRVCSNPVSKYFGRCPKEVAIEWKQVGRQAAMLGTKHHYDIETFLTSGTIPSQPLEKEWEQFERFCRNFSPNYVFKCAEAKIFDVELGIAGTIDAVYQDPSDPTKVHLVDWKRCKPFDDNCYGKYCSHPKHRDLPDTKLTKYQFQLNLYREIIERNTPYKVASMRVVQMHPMLDGYNEIIIDKLDII